MKSRAATPFAATLLAVALVLAAPASAQDEPESRFSGLVQLDVTNAYFFRGVLNEREGIVLQPWAELYYSLFSSEDGFVRDVTVGGGVWNSFHSERTLATESPQWWYEIDYYPLLSIDLAGGVNVTTVYYWYTSPNGGFNSTQEWNVRLAWDDSGVLDAWSMQPWLNLSFETDRTLLGTDRGFGVQAGIGPTLYTAPDDSFTLTLPAEIGLNGDDFYESSSGGENTFGYANVGLAASIPLTGIPESMGAWSLGLSAKYFFFSTTLEKLNRGRSTYPVGVASLSVEF